MLGVDCGVGINPLGFGLGCPCGRTRLDRLSVVFDMLWAKCIMDVFGVQVQYTGASECSISGR